MDTFDEIPDSKELNAGSQGDKKLSFDVTMVAEPENLGKANRTVVKVSFPTNKSGTKNEICVSLVYSGNEKKNFISFPLYTRETQILFFVPEINVKF